MHVAEEHETEAEIAERMRRGAGLEALRHGSLAALAALYGDDGTAALARAEASLWTALAAPSAREG
jgi:hypothetical protein